MKPAALFLILLFILSVGLVACGKSEEKREVSKDHVWKAQEDALRKAEKVDDLVKEADKKNRQKIGESFR